MTLGNGGLVELITVLNMMPNGDRQAILRRLTVAERQQVEVLLGTPMGRGCRTLFSTTMCALLDGARQVGNDHGPTVAAREALLRAATSIEHGTTSPGPSLVGSAARLFRRHGQAG